MNELLIEEFLNGNKNAFNILAKNWQKPIYNFCLKYLGDSELAKDILQLTLMKVYKKLKTLQDRTKFTSWIYQIARNLCLDELKKNKGKKTTMEDSQNEIEKISAGNTENNPLEKLYSTDIRKILKCALNKIPAEQREVIVLKTYQDLKFIQIAEILNLSINTVKARMYLGLKALQPILGQYNLK